MTQDSSLPPSADPLNDRATLRRLHEAALQVASLAWTVQDPARESALAPLGAQIAGEAQSVLKAVEAFKL